MVNDSEKNLDWLEWYLEDAVDEGNEKEAEMLKVLEQIWGSQQKFNEDVIGKEIEEMTADEKKEWLQKYVSGIQEEAVEIQRRFGLKEHRLDRAEKSMENAKLEMIDTFKYLLSAMQLVGMDPEEFIEKYASKSKVVEQRWEQKRNKLTRDKKVIGVDIDGVLANYTVSLMDFINLHPDVDEEYEYGDHDDYKVHRALDIPRDKYNKIKYDYRDSGAIGEMPVIKGAPEALKSLKDQGYTIVLLTSRKKDKHNRIASDTISWLNENDIPYDWIIWGTDKYQKLVDDVYPAEVDYFVEDKKGNAEELAFNGLDVVLMNQEYNKGELSPKENINRVDGWKEALEVIRDER